MAITDPIADMFTRIRNAILINSDETSIPYSTMKAEIARILKEEGYIRFFDVVESGPVKLIRVGIKYDSTGVSAISEIKRVSRPGCRVYVQKRNVPKVLGGIGVSILSTSKGVMNGKSARLGNVGGELIGLVS